MMHMNKIDKLINTFKENVQNFLNRDVTDFTKKHKVSIAGLVTLALLACVGVIITYAYYQVVDTTPIIGGTVANIPDIDIRIKVQSRDSSGNPEVDTNGNIKYIDYAYIPKNKNNTEYFYRYNSTKSNCSNGGTINFNSTTFAASITTSTHDICYLYFDANPNSQADIALNVYVQKDNTTGNTVSDYELLASDVIPNLGYEFNTSLTSCPNGTNIVYNASTNTFSIATTGKGTCNVYMKKVNSDINLTIEIPDGNGGYITTNEIPKNKFYVKNNESVCSPAGNNISLVHQKVIVDLNSPATCVVTLDEGNGPVIGSINVNTDSGVTTISLEEASNSSTINNWYYSTSNPNSDSDFTVVSGSTITLNDITNIDSVWIYADDSNNLQSAIWKVDLR